MGEQISILAGNRLLMGLPSPERALMLPLCEVVALHLGDVMCEAGEPIASLDFPITSAISVLDIRNAENIVEVTVVGNEGCNGSSVVEGGDLTLLSMVATEGRAVRVPAAAMQAILPDMPYLRAALLRHHALVLRHVEISLACRASHSAGQRLAQWLMMHLYRTGLESFQLTPALLATKVGVTAHEATYVLEDFQRHGFVGKGYNTITMTDQEGLGLRACGCLAITKSAIEDYLLELKDLSHAYGS